MDSPEIVILLFDGITALDAVGPYEVFSKIPNSKIFFAALKLTALVRNESLGQIIQLAIEYDPMPPFNAGSPERISKDLLEAFLKINSQRNNSHQ